MANKIKKWEPDDFELETNTVWSFPDRGKWATHDAKYRGNWSPYIPRNLIMRYSQEGDLVLDQFVGGGTTLVEAKLLNRDIVGKDWDITKDYSIRAHAILGYPEGGFPEAKEHNDYTAPLYIK